MIERQETSYDRWLRLQRVLFTYLEGVACPAWPGADGLTVDDVVSCYPQALAAGQVPGLDDLVRRHPELAEELHLFFGQASALRVASGRLTSPVEPVEAGAPHIGPADGA